MAVESYGAAVFYLMRRFSLQLTPMALLVANNCLSLDLLQRAPRQHYSVYVSLSEGLHWLMEKCETTGSSCQAPNNGDLPIVWYNGFSACV